MKVKLAFKPENINTTYVDNFEILAVGLASKACIKCVGQGIGSNVTLDVASLNFGIAKLNDVVTRSLKLRNNSNVDTIFQVSFFLYQYTFTDCFKHRLIIRKSF